MKVTSDCILFIFFRGLLPQFLILTFFQVDLHSSTESEISLKIDNLKSVVFHAG